MVKATENFCSRVRIAWGFPDKLLNVAFAEIRNQRRESVSDDQRRAVLLLVTGGEHKTSQEFIKAFTEKVLNKE